MPDHLSSIFTPEVLAHFRRAADRSEELAHRIGVLTARGVVEDDRRLFHQNAMLRARRASWDAYVGAAIVCGLFDGQQGRDLLSRLRSSDERNFRGALAECMACWLFAGRLGLPTGARPRGREGRVLELFVEISSSVLCVEVKAPFAYASEPVPNQLGVKPLQNALEEANRQFADDATNVLVISGVCQRIDFPRHELEMAFLFNRLVGFKIDRRTGSKAGAIEAMFHPRGFLRRAHADGGLLLPDGQPRYTRAGAIVYVQERLVERGDPWLANFWSVEPDILVLHNPEAERPVPDDIWRAHPQYRPARRGLPEEGVIEYAGGWSDGKGMFER
jgi:hypothetical protein